MFLRILDEREAHEAEAADAVDAEFTPSLAAPYRWRDWAAPPDAGQASSRASDCAQDARKTGRQGCLPHIGWKRAELQNGSLGAFFGFVNGELIPLLKKLREQPNATPRQKVISEIFSGVERTRIDTERNFLDVLDKVNNSISTVPVQPAYHHHFANVPAQPRNPTIRIPSHVIRQFQWLPVGS